MEKLVKKLLEIQMKMKAIVKDETNSAFGGFKYYDINTLIAELKPIINEQKVVVIQPLTTMADGVAGLTTIVIDTESAEKMEYTVPLPQLSDVQKMGGAITYFRRYALTSLFLLEAEDDDGNKAGTPIVPEKGAPKSKVPFSGDWKSYKLKFGKHKGLTLQEAPETYLNWLSGQEIKDPELGAALDAWFNDPVDSYGASSFIETQQ